MTGFAKKLHSLLPLAISLLIGWSASALSQSNRPLGINLTFVSDHAQTLTFVDIFKVSRPWISHRPSDFTWDSGVLLDLDENGWVRSLQADQEAGTLMILETEGAYPAGRYTVLYEGEGELHFDWDATVVGRQPGRIELEVRPEMGIHLVLRSTNPANYVRNIRVIMPGFEEVYQTQRPTHHTSQMWTQAKSTASTRAV